MQIRVDYSTAKSTNPLKISLNKPNSNCSNAIVNSTQLPNYNQADKSMIAFRGKETQNGLNNSIPGFNVEKNFIKQILIDPLSFSNNENIPSSILVAFSDDSIEKSIMENIKQKTNADFVTISEPTNNIIPKLDNILDEARKKYLQNGKRTVVIINDAEKIIGMTPIDAKKYSDFKIDDQDVKYLETLDNNSSKISYFKSLFDHISQVPQNLNDKAKSATTILMITKNPHLVHPDLSSRKGKMKTIVFPIIRGKDIKETIEFEVKKKAELLNLIKSETNLDQSDKLNILSDKAKGTLKELKSNGQLNNLNIDIENIPYIKIIKFTNQSKDKGAFSSKNYNEIAQQSFMNYLENPSIPYSQHFISKIKTTERDITPEKLEKSSLVRKFFLGPHKSQKEILELKDKWKFFLEKPSKVQEALKNWESLKSSPVLGPIGIQLEKYSFLDKLTTITEKKEFIEKFKEFTGFPNLQETSSKIRKEFERVVDDASTKINSRYEGCNSANILSCGYDGVSSVGHRKAMPGSDLNHGFVVIEGNDKHYSDGQLIDEFKNQLRLNTDQRLISFNHSDEFIHVYTKNIIKDSIEYLSDLCPLDETAFNYFKQVRLNATDPIYGAEYNIRIIGDRLSDEDKVKAKNFAYFIEAMREGKKIKENEKYLYNELYPMMNNSQFCYSSNITQMTALRNHYDYTGEYKPKIENRIKLQEEFDSWDIEKQYELVKDIIKSSCNDQSDKFSEYFNENENFKNRRLLANDILDGKIDFSISEDGVEKFIVKNSKYAEELFKRYK